MSEITRPRFVVADPGIYGSAIRRGVTDFNDLNPDVGLTLLQAGRSGLFPALGRFFIPDFDGNIPVDAAVVPGVFEDVVSAFLGLARDPKIAGIELNEDTWEGNADPSLFPGFSHVPQIGPAHFIVVLDPTFPKATCGALEAAYNLLTRQAPATGGRLFP